MTSYPSPPSNARVSICVLTYGDFPDLAKKTINSILKYCSHSDYKLIVGANAVSNTTLDYLQRLKKQGDIHELCVSTENINKCPMMRLMFENIETEYIWWFDDDSYITRAGVLEELLSTADATPDWVKQWGKVYFFGNELDFSYGQNVVGFVQNASWYGGLQPPGWNPGGKGEYDFEGRRCGDGRWFFVTGGNWLIKTEAVKVLNWPDTRLIKRNDDVFLSEAIRQQGWEFQDLGDYGVAVNTAETRGTGEDEETMKRQILAGSGQKSSKKNETSPKGCIFIPTFNDTELLIENYHNRPGISDIIDIHIYDDNFEPAKTRQVHELCRENGWFFHKVQRAPHGEWEDDFEDMSHFNHLIWKCFVELGAQYEFVLKMDTDAYIVEDNFYLEFASLLTGTRALAGTSEVVSFQDCASFWQLAAQYGYHYNPGEYPVFMQGGIYGFSKAATQDLLKMGFFHGNHHRFGEDQFMSFCALLLNIEFKETSTVGSWWHPYRPNLWELSHLKAIHPLSKSEWEDGPGKVLKDQSPTTLHLDADGWFEPEEESAYRSLVEKVSNGTVVELGVWKGKSLLSILDICRKNNNRVIAVDHWDSTPTGPYIEAAYKNIYEVFLGNLEATGNLDLVDILREDSATAARHFEDQSVDLVFIDADHSFEGLCRDLEAWIPKLKEDGVLIGHDYTWFEGVRKALDTVLPNRFRLLPGSLWQMTPELTAEMH